MDEIVTHRLSINDYQKGIDMVISGLRARHAISVSLFLWN